MNLLCCPFCTSMSGVTMIEFTNGEGKTEGAYVECDACLAHGPECETVERAAQFWNEASRIREDAAPSSATSHAEELKEKQLIAAQGKRNG